MSDQLRIVEYLRRVLRGAQHDLDRHQSNSLLQGSVAIPEAIASLSKVIAELKAIEAGLQPKIDQDALANHPIKRTEGYADCAREIDAMISGMPTVTLSPEDWEVLVAAVYGHDRERQVRDIFSNKIKSDQQRLWLLDKNYIFSDLCEGRYNGDHAEEVHTMFRDWNTKLGLNWFNP